MKHYNTSEEMMAVVKKNYEIQMAAIKVYEANTSYENAVALRNTTTYDWTHKDQEGNRRFFEAVEVQEKAEKVLKKAVKNFFNICGKELPSDWKKMCAFYAWIQFRDYVKDFSLYHTDKNPIETFSILATC